MQDAKKAKLASTPVVSDADESAAEDDEEEAATPATVGSGDEVTDDDTSYTPGSDEEGAKTPVPSDDEEEAAKTITAKGKTYELKGRKAPKCPHIDFAPGTPLRKWFMKIADPIDDDIEFTKRRPIGKTAKDNRLTLSQKAAIKTIQKLQELATDDLMGKVQQQAFKKQADDLMKGDDAVRDYFKVHVPTTSTKPSEFKAYILYQYYDRASEAMDAVHYAAAQHIKPNSKGCVEKAFAMSTVLLAAGRQFDWLGYALDFAQDTSPNDGEAAEDYAARCYKYVSLAITNNKKDNKKTPKVYHLAADEDDYYKATPSFDLSLAGQQYANSKK